MKKVVTIFVMVIIIFLMETSYAIQNTIELDFSVLENKENEEFELYILLPERYIEYAIKYAGLYIQYNGANTLKNNTIPGIDVDKEKIQDEVYKEDGEEYVQILLNKQEDGIYKFKILKSYESLDIKFRIKNDKKDYIAHIDNFKTKRGICQIQYDYEKDEIKQPDTLMYSTTIILLIILIIVIIVGTISVIKQRR